MNPAELGHRTKVRLIWVAGSRLSYAMGILTGGLIANLVAGHWIVATVTAVLGCVGLLGCVNYVYTYYSPETVTVGDESDPAPPAGKP